MRSYTTRCERRLHWFGVVDAVFARRFLEDNEAFASIEHLHILGDDEAGSTVRTIRAAGRRASAFDVLLEGASDDLPDVHPRDLAAIFFISGTTGLSKGVMMSHSHMTFFADLGRALTRFTDADTYMSVGPLFHGNAQFLAAYPALIAGGRVVVQERFSATRWIDQIRDGGVTVTNLVGAMMDFVWKQPPRPIDCDNQLRELLSAKR